MKKFLLLFLMSFTFGQWANSQVVFEDFENGGQLTWAPINGAYNGIVANPDATGINPSANVGSFNKPEGEAWSFAVVEMGAPIDLTTNNQFTIQVMSPVEGQILLKLENGDDPIEVWKTIPAINEWVTYHFNFSSAADRTLDKIVLFFDPGNGDTSGDFYFDNLEAHPNTMLEYETFENGGMQTWTGINGSFDGIVADPDTSVVNNVGSFTKPEGQAWSFCLFEGTEAFPLEVNNRFYIDMYAPEATQFLFKIEGGSGAAVEKWVNIPTANAWRTYEIDMSEAAGRGHFKLVVFFDAGNDASSGTYYFDNIVAGPAGPCAGTIPEIGLIDDFECQRNASYGAGWDVLNPVANPALNDINNSAMVGEYVDPEGEPWLPLVIDFNSSMDLSTMNQLKISVYSSAVVPMLYKLEGGVSPAKEVWMDISATEQWVEYTIDFSDQNEALHNKIAIFFNGGNDAGANDIYYIDNIRWDEKEITATALEDFEDGGKLGWMPAGGDTDNHGTFDGIIANPDNTGMNTSENVGQYTKGMAEYSTLTAFLPEGIDLSVDPQLNIHVWAPDGGQSVILKLNSPLVGSREVTRDVTVTGEWTLLEFNLSEFEDITDFESISLLFNPAEAEQGAVWMFDNIIQSTSTVDPCEDVAAIPTYFDDYECQQNVVYTVGGDFLEIESNPAPDDINNSAKVGKYTDPLGAWSALVFTTGEDFDLSLHNQLHLKLYADAAVPMLFKLEGGTSPVKEVWMDVSSTGEWVEYVIDFSDQSTANHTAFALFFNGGNEPGADDVYYIDDIYWTRAAYTGCVLDYETDASSFEFHYFANGHIEAENNVVPVVANPDKTGINDSETVAQFVRANDCDPWAGAYSPLDAPIEFGENKTITAMVYMDHIGNMGMKVEGSTTGAPGIELSVPNTKTNEWEEITFDFSDAADDAQYMRLTMFIDLTIDGNPDMDVVSYFDNFVLGDGDCLETGIFDVPEVNSFSISPNPVSNILNIENMENIKVIKIFNIQGQLISSNATDNSSFMKLDVSNIQHGLYYLAGYNSSNQLISNAKFVVN